MGDGISLGTVGATRAGQNRTRSVHRERDPQGSHRGPRNERCEGPGRQPRACISIHEPESDAKQNRSQKNRGSSRRRAPDS